ncbi:MAG: hypothetical protein JSR33_02070 [Proteobacteria bacterium]|nr:hypothetical protein [Pseudomonadota bacterium]
MKLPNDVREKLTRCFQRSCSNWLNNPTNPDHWPLEIRLGIPQEHIAIHQPEGIHTWVFAWKKWQGAGQLLWREIRWRTLGSQNLPAVLLLHNPLEVSAWIGETLRWQKAYARHQTLLVNWPLLASSLAQHFSVLADYTDVDFERLIALLKWLINNPSSKLYPRQLPIPGMDSKWFEGHKKIVNALLTRLQMNNNNDADFLQRCGLKELPRLVRFLILDTQLRQKMGGLRDITVSWEELANINFSAKRIFIVENLQTGLAFFDIPDTVVFMGLGYQVDILSRLPWVACGQSYYWGDLDTHGFAILNRARFYLPTLQSILMDEKTLLTYQSLWVEEEKPHTATFLPKLTPTEQAVYQGIKQNRLGKCIRLEQERIAWDYAREVISNLCTDIK